MPSTDEVHYVAHLKIERVVRKSTTMGSQKEREVDEVTHITIKASDLPNLVAKLQGHAELIEEE